MAGKYQFYHIMYINERGSRCAVIGPWLWEDIVEDVKDGKYSNKHTGLRYGDGDLNKMWIILDDKGSPREDMWGNYVLQGMSLADIAVMGG